MELKRFEYIDISKYSLCRRKQMFPSLIFRQEDYCIVYLASYGYDKYSTSYYPNYKDMIRALINAGYIERKAVNNWGRM